MELITTVALTLFLVMDPLGNIPLFMAAMRNVPPERHKAVIVRELFIALGILVVMLFLGSTLLGILHISVEALTVGGGLILLLIAVRMIFPTPERNLNEPTPDDEPFIVPLAVPYLAGPSAIATQIIFVNQFPDQMPALSIAVVLAWGGSAIILASSGWLAKVLGEKALTAIERLMGMILAMISVEMLLGGIRAYFS